MTEVTTTQPYWDPYHADQRSAPYDAWRQLRDEAPVYHNERFGFWALSRFADVLAASLDTETFSSAHGITLDIIGDPIRVPMMIVMDPPLHDAFRKVVSRAFTPRRIAALEDRIRQLCAAYLDPFVGAGGFDFVRDFGMRLPVMVISTLLGFPEEDHDQLREWSDISLYREEGKEGRTAAALEAARLKAEYHLTQVEQRRRQPREDMITALVETDLETPDGIVRKLDDLEIMGMIALISSAGNETVARMLGWAAVVLCDYPDARREMTEDPSLIPVGIEELLRYEAPSPIQGRYVTRDVAMNDTVIPQGAKLAPADGFCRARRAQIPRSGHLRLAPLDRSSYYIRVRGSLLSRRGPRSYGRQGRAQRGPATLPEMGDRSQRRNLRRHEHSTGPVVGPGAHLRTTITEASRATRSTRCHRPDATLTSEARRPSCRFIFPGH